MPYIGKSSDGFGIRERYRYSASGSQTAFTGSDLDSKTLQIDSGSLVDVYLNGVLLDTADYNTSTANTITLTSGASTSDEVMIIVYDIFSLSDAMPKTGGTFSGAVTANSTLDMNGTELILDADGDSSIHSSTDDQIDIKVGNVDKVIVTGNGDVSIGGNTPNTYSGFTALTIGGSASTTGSTIDFEDSDGNRDAQVYADANYLYLSNTDVKVETGNLVIGTSGKGIDFSANTHSAVTGASMTSELLDFYEEGDWTPVAYGASTSGSVTSGTLTGKYTRIGRMVHLEARATAVVLSSANGSYYVDGLPFTVGGTGYNSGSASLYKVNFDDNTYVEVNASGTTVYFLVSRDNTTWTVLDQSAFGSQHYWHFTIIYTV